MDPERVLEAAIAAPKMPKGAVFKRSECLALIRELQQSLPDADVVAEFVRVVSNEHGKYLEDPASPDPSVSSAPQFAGDDHMEVRIPLSSAAPHAAARDETMELNRIEDDGTRRVRAVRTITKRRPGPLRRLFRWISKRLN